MIDAYIIKCFDGRSDFCFSIPGDRANDVHYWKEVSGRGDPYYPSNGQRIPVLFLVWVFTQEREYLTKRYFDVLHGRLDPNDLLIDEIGTCLSNPASESRSMH